MKKMISIWLAAVLAISFGSSVFAANVGGVNTALPNTTKIFSPVVKNNMQAGQTIHSPLGLSSFVSDVPGQPVTAGQITEQQLRNTVRITAGTQQDNNNFDMLFTYSLNAIPDARGVTYPYLSITPRALDQGYSFNFSIGLVSKGNGATTPPGSWGSFSGTIQAAQSTIIGFNSAFAPSTSTGAIKQGESFDYIIPDSVFDFSAGTGKTFTAAMRDTYGFTLTSTNSNLTPAFLFTKSGKVGLRVTVNANAPVGTQSGDIYLTGTQNGMQNKSILLHNATITVQSNNAVVTGNKITGIDPDARLGYTNNGIFGRLGLNGTEISSAENLLIRGGDEISIEFDSNFFLWENGKPDPAAWVTSSLIRSGKVTVNTLSGRASNLVESAEIRYVNGRAYIRLKFVDRFVSTKERDFSVTLVLVQGGRYDRNTGIVISGTMENEYISVYADDDYVDLSYGDVAYAEESIRSIEVDMGYGVTIHARMSKGKKYYGTVDMDPSNRDYDLMDKYPEIQEVYNLSTVGFNSSANRVTIDSPRRYYVYNKFFEYLGTTDQKLAYSTKYYLASKQLNIVSDSDSDVDEDSRPDVEEETSYPAQIPSGATPGAVYPDNENYNPVNGR